MHGLRVGRRHPIGLESSTYCTYARLLDIRRSAYIPPEEVARQIYIASLPNVEPIRRITGRITGIKLTVNGGAELLGRYIANISIGIGCGTSVTRYARLGICQINIIIRHTVLPGKHIYLPQDYVGLFIDYCISGNG